MERKTLEEKRLSVERDFNALVEKDKSLKEELRLNSEEELKLSGEYRLISELLNNLDNQVTKKEPKKNG